MNQEQILVDEIDKKQRRYVALCVEGLNEEIENQNPESNREFELIYRENSRPNLELAISDGNLLLAQCIRDYMALKNDDPYAEYRKLHKPPKKKIKPTEFIKEVPYVKIIGRFSRLMAKSIK